MLFEIMKHIRNFFPTGKCVHGKFKIENGTVSLSFVSSGQYILIEGSTMNDGVYQYPLSNLSNEEFEGDISVLAPPKAVLSLASDIESWVAENGKRGAYQSESFGGYSYTKATNADGSMYDWQDAFKQRLNAWRKL